MSERVRSEESEDRMIGFLKRVRNFGRALCNYHPNSLDMFCGDWSHAGF